MIVLDTFTFEAHSADVKPHRIVETIIVPDRYDQPGQRQRYAVVDKPHVATERNDGHDEGRKKDAAAKRKRRAKRNRL